MSSQPHEIPAQRALPTENEFVDVRGAAEALNVSISFLNKARMGKHGPPYLKFGARMVRYRLADVREWGRQQSRTSTSE